MLVIEFIEKSSFVKYPTGLLEAPSRSLNKAAEKQLKSGAVLELLADDVWFQSRSLSTCSSVWLWGTGGRGQTAGERLLLLLLAHESCSERLDPPQNKLYHQRGPDGRVLDVRHTAPSDWQSHCTVTENNRTCPRSHLIKLVSDSFSLRSNGGL